MGRGNNDITGGAGNDDLAGRDGSDTLDGGIGNDTLAGGNGDDTLLGGNGDDLLLGDFGADTLAGGDGDDTVIGGQGADKVDAGCGDDLIISDDGNDDITGGCGDDTLSFEGYTGDLGVNLADGIYTNENGFDSVLVGVEAIVAGAGNDTMRGSSADETLTGGAGNDDFVFAQGFGDDVIADFTHCVDVIDFSAQLLDFEDLTIRAATGGAEVETPTGDTIFLAGIDAADIGEKDFYFGETLYEGTPGR